MRIYYILWWSFREKKYNVWLASAGSSNSEVENAESTAPQEGRPSKVWGIRKAFARTQMNISRPDELPT